MSKQRPTVTAKNTLKAFIQVFFYVFFYFFGLVLIKKNQNSLNT